jgi:uncharacterized membrane-anchored protein YhcB (DUF1043 family)
MPKLSPLVKYIAIAFVCGLFLGYLVAIATLHPKVVTQTIEVEKYIISESEKIYDSLSIELVKSNQKIKDLEKIKYEKIKTHKPLERVIITDSARQSNVNRFFR